MPGTSSGKWVSRAASTGGGRTYRGQVPLNWYAALVIIVVLGIVSVIFARYEYQNPSSSKSTTPPTVGTTWFAGYAVNICGTEAPPLASNAASSTAKQSFFTTGKGVITISPRSASAAGDNATLGKFVAGYPGLALSSHKLQVPTSQAHTKTYTDGQACPAGSPDAGKTGQVVVDYWPSAFATHAKPVVVHGNPADLKFRQNQLITIGFVPAGTKLAKPNGSVVTALVQASTASSTTTTPASTTAPTGVTSTTTAPSTTTTAPTTSTTKAKKP